jgi:hypothetical protein
VTAAAATAPATPRSDTSHDADLRREPALVGGRAREDAIELDKHDHDAPARPARTIVFDDNDDLDVPEFLR